jgi:tetratricopeptide (TPR) repeat protein
MRLIVSLYRLFAGKRPETDSDAVLAPASHCPHEAEILTYSEGKLSNRTRAELESHFVNCNDCRSLLMMLARFNSEPSEVASPISEDGVKKQTARILAFIEADERKRSFPLRETNGQKQVQRGRKGFFVSYPQLVAAALVICAIAAGVIGLLISNEKPKASAREALAKAMKDERRGETRISGGLEYSPHPSTRGTVESDDLQLNRAFNKWKFAESDNAPAEARLNLARVHLAFAKPDHARRALVILEQLMARGIESHEVLNDLGVAKFQLHDYEEAVAHFNKALEKKPDYSEALFNRALAEESLGRYSDAKQSWQQFINLSSDANWKEEAERHLSVPSNPPNQ